jgi:hypothetical protein
MFFETWAKKDGTNGFCSCREASDANYFQLWCDQDRSPSLEYIHDTIDWFRSKYKNSDFLAIRDERNSRTMGIRTRIRTQPGNRPGSLVDRELNDK